MDTDIANLHTPIEEGSTVHREHARPLETGHIKSGTYGTMGTLDEKDWHKYGRPWFLLMASGVSLGMQCFALGVIVRSVFFSHEHLLNCDPKELGFAKAAFCEYTKAYVRCFPLFAIIVSLNVASRQILQHRMYYQLLKHGVLLDLDFFQPLADPLFQIVIWCIVNASAHFLFSIYLSNGMHMDKIVRGEIKEAAVFYTVPTGMFLIFLYTAYDLELKLLPLSKYFEQDPDDARRALNDMAFIREAAAAAALTDLNKQDGGPSANLREAIQQLTKLAETKIQEAKEDPGAIPPLSRWRLMGTLWPARFLLHPRRLDRGSRNFIYVWYLIGAFNMSVIIFVFTLFVVLMYGKIENIIHGQPEDGLGLVVAIAHAGMTVLLAAALIDNIMVPFPLPHLSARPV